ncbi:MAG: histidine phosphatase family protein [Phycisphaerae bacterium]|nr:histidine phosphatase family protein [Phycisphaerae bacterium]
MKTLFLLRHAKSSWNQAGLTDRQRPLNRRGRRDAPEMGRRLARRDIGPDLIVSSPAERALTTAKIVAEQLGRDPARVLIDTDIYAASVPDLLQVIRDFDPSHACILLVGHNPALTDTVNHLTGSVIPNVPTCGLAEIEMAEDAWASAGENSARLVNFDYPKNTPEAD